MLLLPLELILDIITYVTEVDKYWMYRCTRQITQIKHFNKIKLIEKRHYKHQTPKYNFYSTMQGIKITKNILSLEVFYDKNTPKIYPITLIKLSTTTLYFKYLDPFPQSVKILSINCYISESIIFLELNNVNFNNIIYLSIYAYTDMTRVSSLPRFLQYLNSTNSIDNDIIFPKTLRYIKSIENLNVTTAEKMVVDEWSNFRGNINNLKIFHGNVKNLKIKNSIHEQSLPSTIKILSISIFSYSNNLIYPPKLRKLSIKINHCNSITNLPNGLLFFKITITNMFPEITYPPQLISLVINTNLFYEFDNGPFNEIFHFPLTLRYLSTNNYVIFKKSIDAYPIDDLYFICLDKIENGMIYAYEKINQKYKFIHLIYRDLKENITIPYDAESIFLEFHNCVSTVYFHASVQKITCKHTMMSNKIALKLPKNLKYLKINKNTSDKYFLNGNPKNMDEFDFSVYTNGRIIPAKKMRLVGTY